MLRKLVLVCAIALVATTTLASYASTHHAKASTPAQPSAKTAVGEITAVDTSGNTLTAKVKGKSDVFNLGANVAVYNHGKTALVSDLKPGQKVEITYKTEGQTMTASRVAVLG